MAQESSFFNAQLINGAYDRVYNAENWAAYFASFLGNGVSIVPKTTLQVQAGTGMTAIVDKGIAFINGYRYANTMPYELTINPANATYARISIVILELNLNERNILLKVVDGTPSDTPIAPALIRTSGIYQLQLASILIQPGSTQISNITDTRDDISVCGFIEGLFGQGGIRTEDQLLAINREISNLSNIYLTNKSAPILSNNWTFDSNANLYFNNSNQENIIGLAVNNNQFSISNCLQGNSVLTWTPVQTGTDTIDIYADLNFINSTTIGFSDFNNTETCNIGINYNTFNLTNALQNTSPFTWTPAATGNDMFNIVANVDMSGNLTTAGTVNMASTVNMTGNVNTNGTLNITGDAQIHGTQIWAGGDSNGKSNTGLSGQISVSVPGETNAAVNYSIQYWEMNMCSVVNPSTLPTAGIGILTITLQGNGNWDWTGSFNLDLLALTSVNEMNAITLGKNPQFDIVFEQGLDMMSLNNINIVANTSGNANSYTASALIYS